MGLKQMKTLAADGSVVPRRRGPSVDEEEAQAELDELHSHAEPEAEDDMAKGEAQAMPNVD